MLLLPCTALCTIGHLNVVNYVCTATFHLQRVLSAPTCVLCTAVCTKDHSEITKLHFAEHMQYKKRRKVLWDLPLTNCGIDTGSRSHSQTNPMVFDGELLIDMWRQQLNF